MRLLRIELQGFKSFSDKMSIDFVQDGISVVVGPNGCGKSNIVDAIRWVLGEQSAKHLRGSSMEDVIFGGSASRPQLNLAQVTLTFSNNQSGSSQKYAEFNEISVTRVLYRNGDSRYLINKTACRLTDIRELFMDTGIGGKGYSIIEQGRVDQIVTSRPEDRRNIIDEAAGIVKFKTKKRDAENKFAKTKDNLLRVEDILQELIRQEESLKVQVEKAEEYLGNKARLERLQQCSVTVKWVELKRKGEELLERRADKSQRQEDYERKIAVLEADEAALNLEITQKSQELDEQRQVIQGQREEIIKLEGKQEADKKSLENLADWWKQSEEEEKSLQLKIQSLEEQLNSQDDDADTLVQEIEQSSELLELLKEKNRVQDGALEEQQEKLEACQQEELQLITQISGDRTKIVQIRERLQESQQHIQELETNLYELEDEEGRIKKIIAKDSSEIKEEKARKEQLLTSHNQLAEQIGEEEHSFLMLEQQAKEHTQQINQLENRLLSQQEIIQSHEEFDLATKSFLDHLDRNPEAKEQTGFMGTLADLVSAQEGEHIQSSAFLNHYFNLLIFRDIKDLAKIKEYIFRLELDQIQLFFLNLRPQIFTEPLESLTRWIHSQSNPGLIIPLTGFFHPLDKIISDLEPEFLSQAEGVIDQESSIMTREKIFYIGKPGRANVATQYLKRRSEVAELEQKLQILQKEGEKIQAELSAKEEALGEKREGFQAIHKEMIALDLHILGLDKEIKTKIILAERLLKDRENLIQEAKQAAEVQSQFKEEIKTISQKMEQNEKEQLEIQKKITSQRRMMDDLRMEKEELQEELQHIQISYNNLLNRQKNIHSTKERLQKECRQAEEQRVKIATRIGSMSEQKTKLQAALSQAEEELPRLIKKLSTTENTLRERNDTIETDRGKLLAKQKEVQEHQKQIAEFTEESHKLEIKLAQFAQEAANIEENLYSDFSITPQDLIQTFNLEEFDLKREEQEIKKLKIKVAENIHVNLAAKEEYDTLVERLNFLQTQSDDLKSSLEALESSIHKINRESRRRFRQAFNQINEKFSQLFPKLFGGGEAYLQLTDEDNLLETGVEIIARPPGKKLQNMTLLSGGEKAMTAIAMIFAIFLIKPSPFCLLDEVDAPLDEVNNSRFNQHVTAMTENSQFIIITHNKKTMEIGDALFGVTMEEPGTSKIVSVDFQKAELAEMVS
jgi:chromosome segregation protein